MARHRNQPARRSTRREATAPTATPPVRRNSRRCFRRWIVSRKKNAPSGNHSPATSSPGRRTHLGRRTIFPPSFPFLLYHFQSEISFSFSFLFFLFFFVFLFSRYRAELRSCELARKGETNGSCNLSLCSENFEKILYTVATLQRKRFAQRFGFSSSCSVQSLRLDGLTLVPFFFFLLLLFFFFFLFEISQAQGYFYSRRLPAGKIQTPVETLLETCFHDLKH